jgi:Aspartyl protease/PDZ domain
LYIDAAFKMRKLFCLIPLLLICLLPYAQELLQKPKAELITRFPFKLYNGGVMVLQAKLGINETPLNFILDTGSGGISLDSATCSEINISPVKTDTTITGIAGVKKVPFVFNETLHLPGLDVTGLNFHVVDYSVLSSVYGEKIDGVIGYAFLNRYIVKINFDSVFLEVYSPGAMEYPSGGTTLHPIFTALPIQWLNIKDKRKMGFNFYIDTGAGLNLLLNEQFVADSNLLRKKRKPVVTQAEGVGGRLRMRLTVIKRLKVGPYTFFNVPTYLYADSFNVTAYPFVGGLLGNDLLRRFNLTLNYPERNIHLLPNTHFKEPFDYVYSGLGIYFENGSIKVEEVIPGSPAEKAGIKAGDILVSVGANFSNNIMSYKTILQTQTGHIKLIIRRGDKLIETSIKTISIF